MNHTVSIFPHTFSNCTCFAALAAGDPHLATLDGKEYSFNGVGDFILVQDVNSSVVIQVRAEQATDKDGMYIMPISTLGRWQSKTFLTIEKYGTKIARNRATNGNKNSVSDDFFYLRSSIVLTFSIVVYPV